MRKLFSRKITQGLILKATRWRVDPISHQKKEEDRPAESRRSPFIIRVMLNGVREPLSELLKRVAPRGASRDGTGQGTK